MNIKFIHDLNNKVFCLMAALHHLKKTKLSKEQKEYVRFIENVNDDIIDLIEGLIREKK